jgi:acyl dehydratase
MVTKANDIEALKIGESVSFSKTISESDVYLFAGITGDFSPNHINEEYMKSTKYKKRIAHGVLSIGLASTASTMMGNIHRERRPDVVRANYGYDRIRFIKPIFIGDTITVHYTIKSINMEKNTIISDVRIINQRQELVTVAINIIKVL